MDSLERRSSFPEAEEKEFKGWQLLLVWLSVIALAVLGVVGLWHNPTNFFCTVLVWPLPLWAAIAPSGKEPR